MGIACLCYRVHVSPISSSMEEEDVESVCSLGSDMTIVIE